MLRGSLRGKIIAWSFVPTAIILVAVALVSLYAYQRVTENLVIERDEELIRLSAQLLGRELTSYVNPFAEQYLAIFDGFIFFDADGEIVAAEPMQYERYRPAWLRESALVNALNRGEPVFFNVVSDAARGEEIVVVVMPITNQLGRRTGGMAGFFRLGERADSVLYSGIENLVRGESSAIYLVDGQGRVIYHSNPDYIGHNLAGQPMVDLVIDGWSGAYRTEDVEGQQIVASFAPVPGTPWGLVMEENWAALTETSRRYGQLLIVLLALGVLVPTLIVSVGVRRITRPIGDLIAAAREIAGGHLSRRVEARSGDEIEALADQFNQMAMQLQESYAHLEQKVADRTRELATLNTIAAQVSHSLDLSEILNSALEEVIEAMGMDGGQAFRLDEEAGTLVPIAWRGLPAQDDHCYPAPAAVPLAGSLAGRAAAEGRPVVHDLSLRTVGAGKAPHQEETGPFADLDDGGALALAVSIPLIAQGRPVGAINLGSCTHRPVTAEEMSLLASIGQQIGVAVENARLYEQAQQLAVMKERNRLARDLHDSVTQALYGVSLYAEAAARQLSRGSVDLAAQHLNDIRATAQESLREMRLLIFELRLPVLQSEGLAAAIQTRLEAVESRVGLETSFHYDGNGHLSPEVEDGLYRIAQEALNNALKHAQAHSVAVQLCHEGGTAILEITDDGLGFDRAAATGRAGFGLQTMEERAARLGGRLTIDSTPGQGTRVRVEVAVSSETLAPATATIEQALPDQNGGALEPGTGALLAAGVGSEA
ncbi:MAG TPA: GAF domain-containing protein [Anaerolineae bacterium]|nr:GAF domain-containing protein [Anaerolineae bacterium]